MTGFIAVCIFAVGCLVGALIHKLVSSRTGTASKLSRDLDHVSQDFADYQDKVNAHFQETAELVHNLTQNYVAVHQKLAVGAQELSRSSLKSLAAEAVRSEKNAPLPEKLSAPIDYAEPESPTKEKETP